MLDRRTRSPILFLAALTALSSVAPLGAQTAPPPAPAADATATLPTAEKLLARHLSAIGGADAVGSIARITSRGTFEMPAAGVKGPTTIHAEEPLRFLMVMELPGVGAVRSGYDGTTAWSMDPMQGPRLIEGKEFDQIKRDADFRRDLNLFDECDRVEVKGETVFAGGPAYEVLCVAKGAERTYFFSKQDGLLRGMRMVAESPMGQIPVETSFVEYKEYEAPGGTVRMPARTEIAMLNQKQVLTIERVEFGPIEPSTFELPKEIAALAERAKAERPAEAAPPQRDGQTPSTTPAPPATPTKPTTPATGGSSADR